MTKKWKIFERIIAKIYEIKLSDFKPEIKHNVILKGKSGASHQIDVLVELSLPLINIREIIEVKRWQSRVKKSVVMQINEITDDVNANRATIISRKGFQKGAIQYATHHGINLYRILTPKELGVHTLYI
ncbi:restriction endonuclease [Candidatus Borrarchaeum sp.]|uniref:restriction endonuclease n=1 Tax=Candidatus Borrarchaeum sp. TaxID=2846742 RepID=UPI00257C70E8|nr:restriction endonuclease [Candidatus Borrarchaeum sp.]